VLVSVRSVRVRFGIRVRVRDQVGTNLKHGKRRHVPLPLPKGWRIRVRAKGVGLVGSRG
jgi:hypothetical protein